MALTVQDTSPVPNNVAGGLRTKYVTLTGDTSYPTGGYPLTALTLGMTSVEFVNFSDASALGLQATYDYANQKVKLFWCAGSGAAMSEVTNATNIATWVARAEVKGV